jgi:hypothetical protein
MHYIAPHYKPSRQTCQEKNAIKAMQAIDCLKRYNRRTALEIAEEGCERVEDKRLSPQVGLFAGRWATRAGQTDNRSDWKTHD